MRIALLRRLFFGLILLGLLTGSVPDACADSPPLGPIPAEASSPNIDPVAATRAYLATVPPAAHARSDAYFEGGYWLILWNALLSSAISLLLLSAGWSAAWRDKVSSISNRLYQSGTLCAHLYAGDLRADVSAERLSGLFP